MLSQKVSLMLGKGMSIISGPQTAICKACSHLSSICCPDYLLFLFHGQVSNYQSFIYFEEYDERRHIKKVEKVERFRIPYSLSSNPSPFIILGSLLSQILSESLSSTCLVLIRSAVLALKVRSS